MVVLPERREEQRGGVCPYIQCPCRPSLLLPVSTSIYSRVSPGRRRQHRQHLLNRSLTCVRDSHITASTRTGSPTGSSRCWASPAVGPAVGSAARTHTLPRPRSITLAMHTGHPCHSRQHAHSTVSPPPTTSLHKPVKYHAPFTAVPVYIEQLYRAARLSSLLPLSNWAATLEIIHAQFLTDATQHAGCFHG